MPNEKLKRLQAPTNYVATLPNRFILPWDLYKHARDSKHIGNRSIIRNNGGVENRLKTSNKYSLNHTLDFRNWKDDIEKVEFYVDGFKYTLNANEIHYDKNGEGGYWDCQTVLNLDKSPVLMSFGYFPYFTQSDNTISWDGIKRKTTYLIEGEPLAIEILNKSKRGKL